MDKAKIIAAQIGQRNIASALGIGVTAVNNAVVRGRFPATWFPVIRKMCEVEGIICSEDAFNFKARPCDHSETFSSFEPNPSAEPSGRRPGHTSHMRIVSHL
jgi:hypothetical protein